MGGRERLHEQSRGRAQKRSIFPVLALYSVLLRTTDADRGRPAPPPIALAFAPQQDQDARAAAAMAAAAATEAAAAAAGGKGGGGGGGSVRAKTTAAGREWRGAALVCVWVTLTV